MFFRTNKAMALRYPDGLAGLEAPLPKSLKKIIASGLVEIDGCVYLKAMGKGNCAGSKKAKVKEVRAELVFPDRTGLECFENKLHIEDYAYINTVETGVSFLREVSCLLRKHFPARKFRGIIGVSDYADVILEPGYQPRGEIICDVRFHTLRAGETWLQDDLDIYNECVGVCDL